MLGESLDVGGRAGSWEAAAAAAAMALLAVPLEKVLAWVKMLLRAVVRQTGRVGRRGKTGRSFEVDGPEEGLGVLGLVLMWVLGWLLVLNSRVLDTTVSKMKIRGVVGYLPNGEVARQPGWIDRSRLERSLTPLTRNWTEVVVMRDENYRLVFGEV